jgi:hypothetical protein
MMKKPKLKWAALAVLILLWGCTDGEVRSNVSEDVRIQDDPGSPQSTDEYFLVPAGGTNLEVSISKIHPLDVFLYSKDTGVAVEGQTIDFEILETETDEASLSARSATTDSEGRARVDLRAGGVLGSLQIAAEHPSSNRVVFQIEILPQESGGIRVQVKNTAPSIMPLSDIGVRVYSSSDFTCDEFRPLFNQPEPIAEAMLARIDQDTQFDGLDTRSRYVVTGVARGVRGQVAAGACMDGLVVELDRNTDIELLLQLIPINPVGTYDVVSHWDFVDVVAESGTVGATLVRILNLFENPGRAIYDELINLVEALVGGIISGGIDLFLQLTSLDDRFEQMINDFIAGNDALSKIVDAGRDLRDVIANLEVRSELTIGKLSSNYEFRGTDNWHGVTLYWRWNCDENSPPECGAIDIFDGRQR